MFHASDCAVHNAPALPVGPCDCRPLLSDLEDEAVARLQAKSGLPEHVIRASVQEVLEGAQRELLEGMIARNAVD